MICPNCKEESDSLKSVIRKGTLLTGCGKCLSTSLQHGTETTHGYYKRQQQTQYRRELTQPVDPREYIKAYGVDGARNRGMSDETIRKYST